MPGEISKSNPGPKGNVPYVPSWILDMEPVTVCASCLRASCWQGSFYCEKYKTAETVEKTRGELRKLNLESSDYWEPK